MAVLRESPWYQEILKEGLQEGENLGQANFAIRQLSKRFGQLETDICLKIRGLSASQIEDLADNIFDFTSIEDLKNWLNKF